MKYLFRFSLLLNLLLLGAGIWGLQRLGGWRYAIQRLQGDAAGPYENRLSLFRSLPARPGAVVFLGDSHIEQGEWAEWYPDSIPVLNRGIVGDYATGVQARLDEVLRHQPRKIFLLVGFNDLLFNKSPEEITATICQITETIRKKSPQTTICWISLPPVNEQVRACPVGNSQIKALNTLLRQQAYHYTVQWIDIHPSLCDPDARLRADYTADGVHLNGKGYSVISEQLSVSSQQ
jgi:lysophospholipase L1-like esterase